MIGLPGHFLLGSRPTRPGEERIFVDPFHGGAILSLQDCAQIVAHYGVAWSAELANPVPHSEVWGRMVRNLLNCHKRNGDVDQVRTRACCAHRTPPSHPPTRISPHLPTSPHISVPPSPTLAQVMMHEQLLPQAAQLPVRYPSAGDSGGLAAEQVHSHTMLRQLLQSILQMQEEAADAR